MANRLLRKRYYVKLTKVYRKPLLAQEIFGETGKSLSQATFCARDIRQNRQKSMASHFLRKRYWAKLTKVYRKPLLAQEIFGETVKSLWQTASCARDIRQN